MRHDPIMTAMGAVVIGVLAWPAIKSHAEPYIALQGGGAQIWQACSNSNELEGRCGLPLTGWTAGGAIGVSRDLSPNWRLRSEIEASHRAHDIHGYNGPNCPRDDCSADDLDDNTLGVTAGMVNAMPGYRLTDRVELYGGVGLGAGYFTGLDDSSWAPLVQGRAGVSIGLIDNLSIDLSGNVMQSIVSPSIAGNSVEYTAYGPVLRVTYQFGGNDGDM